MIEHLRCEDCAEETVGDAGKVCRSCGGVNTTPALRRVRSFLDDLLRDEERR